MLGRRPTIREGQSWGRAGVEGSGAPVQNSAPWDISLCATSLQEHRPLGRLKVETG